MSAGKFLDGLSVRVLIESPLRAIGGILAVICVVSVISAWGETMAAHHVSRIAVASRHFVQAYGDVRVERGSTLAGLNGNDPISPELAEAVLKKRQSAQGNLEAGLAAAEQAGVPGTEALIAELRDGNAAVERLWPGAEAAIRRSKADRPADLARNWDAAGSKLLDAIVALSEKLEAAMRGRDPQIDHLVSIKQAAAATRVSSGQAILMMAPVLSGERKFTADLQVRQGGYLGEAAAAWAIVKRLSAHSATPANIVDAVARTEKEFFGQAAESRKKVLDALANGEPVAIGVKEWLGQATVQLPALDSVGVEAMNAAVDRTGERASAATTRLVLNALGLVAVIGGLVLAARLVSRRIIVPMQQITGVMKTLAGGDLTVQVPYADARDEIGEMAKAIRIFAEGMIQAEALRAEDVQKSERTRVINNLVGAFNIEVTEALQFVNGSAVELTGTSQSMSDIARRASSEVAAVASAVEETAASMRTASGSVDQLAQSGARISQRVGESVRITGAAAAEAERTTGLVNSLSQAVDKIGAVVSLINDIAAQTNLLALNATIEAARAGDAGKGFAVVANEVKILAGQTAKATDEIGTQIATVQKVTGEAVAAINSITKVIDEITRTSTGIADAVAEQEAATGEIAGNIQQVAQATGEVSGNVVAVNQATEETGQAAAKVLVTAQAVAEGAAALRGRVDAFLTSIGKVF